MPFVVLVASAGPTLTTLLPRLFISMAIVIGVMWIAARVVKNRQIPGSGGIRLTSPKKAPIVQVLARQGVGRNASVTVIRVGDKALVLGVTETTITNLGEFDESALQEIDVTEAHGTGSLEIAAAAISSARKGLLEQVRERTVRKS